MPRIPRTRRRIAALAALASAAALVAGTTSAAAAPSMSEVGTWGASTDRTGATVNDQTVRDIVHTDIGGSGLRVALSNVFGSQAVTFGHITVGVRQSGADVVPGTNQQVTFSGSPSVKVPAGAEVLSDPLPGDVAAQQDLAVSIYVQGAAGTVTGHNFTAATSYLSGAGDHAGEDAGTAFATTISNWYWLEGLAVSEHKPTSTVVAFGDSITDGVGSTRDTNQRWPDDLARRLLARPPAQQMGVVDEGISGNKILTDGAGVSALARLDRDVLAQPGARTVILLEGINDLSGGATADQVIAGQRQLITRVHAAGKCIVGATLTPFGNASDTEQAAVRTVNDFIRNSGEFDGVADFNKAVRDPADPDRMLPIYDSGDSLHPSDAGYRVMADSVDLKQLSCAR
jgi:lysophospholipase L1-like esterase